MSAATLKIIFASFIGDVKQETRGFVKKDLEKVAALNTVNGVICEGVSFSHDVESDYHFSANFLVKKLPLVKQRRFFNSWRQKKSDYAQLDNFLQSATCDAVISRYEIASRSLYKLVKKYPGKIVFEHNTFEYDEYLLGVNTRRSLLKFSLKPGYFFYYIESKAWPLFCEKYYGPKIRRRALGATAVTNEIAAHQNSVCKNYKCAVITNGIHYNDALLHKAPAFNGRDLYLFMLIGTGASWHGTDKLMKGLSQYKGPLNIYITFIGYYLADDVTLCHQLGLENRVRFLDPLSSDSLDRELDKHHISIGTLAVHRKNLKEASPLKVRDSLMRGFPNIIGYHDPDLSGAASLEEFILQLPADENPVDFNEVERFATKVLNMDNYPSTIARRAKPFIDFNSKALQTVDFIKSLRTEVFSKN